MHMQAYIDNHAYSMLLSPTIPFAMPPANLLLPYKQQWVTDTLGQQHLAATMCYGGLDLNAYIHTRMAPIMALDDLAIAGVELWLANIALGGMKALAYMHARVSWMMCCKCCACCVKGGCYWVSYQSLVDEITMLPSIAHRLRAGGGTWTDCSFEESKSWNNS